MDEDEVKNKEKCKRGIHAFEVEYYGLRCKRCGIFFPDNSNWWDVEKEG